MSPRKDRLDEEIATLYAVPLESFVAERTALASRLKKEKDSAAAEEVKALRKPAPSAWAVNQLFQHEPAKMAELLGAGERARKALHEAITSGGAESLRGTIREARERIEDLRQRALEFLSEGGRPANPAMGERIGTNLQSLTFTPDAAETARRGWLDADLDPPGFEVLAGLQVAAGSGRPARPAKEAPPLRPHRAPAEERPARAEKPKAPSLRDREEARQKAEREREEARLLEKVEAATSAAESAAAEAATLQEEAEEAARAAAEARKKAERAQDKADRAAEALARAREALEEARKGAKVLAHPGAGGRSRRS